MKQRFVLSNLIPLNTKRDENTLVDDVADEIIKQRLLPMRNKTMIDFHWIEPDRSRKQDEISASGRKIILKSLEKAGIIQSNGWDAFIGFRDHYIINSDVFGVCVYLDDYIAMTDTKCKLVRASSNQFEMA